MLRKGMVSQSLSSIEAPTYRNRTPVVRLGGKDLTLWDVAKVALSARLNDIVQS